MRLVEVGRRGRRGSEENEMSLPPPSGYNRAQRRKRQCRGKHRYESEEQARLGLSHVAAKYGGRVLDEVVVYRCPFRHRGEEHWHFGHRPVKNTGYVMKTLT